jgi:hypothetical protein
MQAGRLATVAVIVNFIGKRAKNPLFNADIGVQFYVSVDQTEILPATGNTIGLKTIWMNWGFIDSTERHQSSLGRDR